jgi:subtilisin family serine protease
MSAPQTQPMGGDLALSRTTPVEEPVLGVFVRVRNAAGLEEIRNLGGEIGSVIEDFATARVPLNALEILSRSPNIVNIEAARALRLDHDSSTRAVHVDELRTLVGDRFIGATGEGAIVGIYDSGLDLTHSDFIDADGRTRVLSLWDQTTPGRPPQGMTYGWYCSADDVQQAVTSNGTAGCPQRDTHGHGTHVTGTAAGDGSASNSSSEMFRYAGVAPNAGLIIVNGGPGVFFENQIIDGLTWMRQEGLRLNRPVVANLSLGGQFGPHDGTRLYERIIDALSGPGFIVVISSGNSGVNMNTTRAASRRERPRTNSSSWFSTTPRPVTPATATSSTSRSGMKVLTRSRSPYSGPAAARHPRRTVRSRPMRAPRAGSESTMHPWAPIRRTATLKH